MSPMRAAILTQLNSPLEIDELVICGGALEYGQVFVRMLMSGICGAQLQEIRGEKGNAKFIPHLLGHEGCGIVEAVGQGVTRVKVGDKVICHWRKASGIEAPSPKFYRKSDGQTVVGAGKVTTFATHSVISENRLTAVPSETPPELCALLGCSLSTALATIEYEAKLKWGESILIVGCGGLGANLIRAAKLARAGRIVVLEANSSKESHALALGADQFITPMSPLDTYDVVIETSGAVDAIEYGIESLAPTGRMIMVGHPQLGTRFTVFNPDHLFGGSGKSIKASQGGSFEPDRDAARYVKLVTSGALSIAGIVSHRIKLDDINEGLELVRRGGASRVMIDFAI